MGISNASGGIGKKLLSANAMAASHHGARGEAASASSAQECLAQPVVIFTRDIAMRITIIEQLYTQRLVETARTTGTGVEFRFARSMQTGQAGPFGITRDGIGGETGFGCEDPDVL